MHVQLPAADLGGEGGSRSRGTRGLRPSFDVEVPPGSSPATLRPDPRVQVLVPHDEVLPRGMKRGAIPTR